MGFLRQRKRATKHKIIKDIVSREAAKRSVRAVEKLEEERESNEFAQALGEAIILVMAFEHIDRHHTGPWLRKWLRDFNSFGDAVRRSKKPLSELIKIINDECKLDILAEFEACMKEEATTNE